MNEKLEVPEHLRDKANLYQGLLSDINGFLSKEEAVADACLSRLSDETYVDGMLTMSAFRIGMLVGRLIPYYVKEPAIQNPTHTTLLRQAGPARKCKRYKITQTAGLGTGTGLLCRPE